MERAPVQALDPATSSGISVADRDIRGAEGIDQQVDVGALDLPVGRQGENDVSGRVLEADHQGGGFAKDSRERYDRERLASGRRVDPGRPRRIVGPSSTKMNSNGIPRASSGALYSRIELLGIAVALADRNDDGYMRRAPPIVIVSSLP